MNIAIAALCTTFSSEASIKWNEGVETKSTPTYQTSINPLYRIDGLEGSSNISSKVYENMKLLQADYVRHVPWFPYPRLAVAELFEPTNVSGVCKTYWNFTVMDPLITSLFNSTLVDHPIVMGFATSPEWMWQSGVPVPPVNQRDVPYEQGKTLRDPTFKEITSYYVRLAKYYTKGGFVDECGNFIKGYNYPDFQWWEVFNEIEAEHSLSVAYYDTIYDTIVAALREFLPTTKFLGLAMGSHNQFEYYTYHLNNSNHNPKTTPLDGISYHQYVGASGNLSSMAKSYFSQMDTFVAEATKIEAIKHSYQSSTETFINEIGCASGSYMEDGFYSLCAATYAYLFAKGSVLKIEHFGMSQVIGFTGRTLCDGCSDEWPSTSMVDWYSGEGNARYWALKILIEQFPTGSKVAHNTTSPEGVAVQAFTVGQQQKILLVNTMLTSTDINLNIVGSYHSVFVSPKTGNQFSCAANCTGNRNNLSGSYTLDPLEIAVVIPDHAQQ
eukprot:TRINITY_DN9621_c0_g1_i3.p1 TRINITY_DN9621_c0_g1~~TRINITY_DN9621_c0_g1_i3.p1  ORF type:complete len:513 (+),score=91.04 TRINITY_DN9621_c0_g1_i3:49-1539(+)